jgi:molecular chaperone GrpE
MNRDHPRPATEPQTPPPLVVDPGSVDPVTLRSELTAQKDAYLRLAADFENHKKRTLRDSERRAAAEKESFTIDLLPVLDNLERALASEQLIFSEQSRKGVEMAWRQLHQVLLRHGIEAVEDVGQPFDPNRHEAVSLRNDSTQPDKVILEVTQRGYCRGDRVFRRARVVVNDLKHSPGSGRAH